MKTYLTIILISTLACFTIVFISKANKEKKEAEARLELKNIILKHQILLNKINDEANRIKDSLRNEQRKIYFIR